MGHRIEDRVKYGRYSTRSLSRWKYHPYVADAWDTPLYGSLECSLDARTLCFEDASRIREAQGISRDHRESCRESTRDRGERAPWRQVSDEDCTWYYSRSRMNSHADTVDLSPRMLCCDSWTYMFLTSDRKRRDLRPSRRMGETSENPHER